MNYTTRSPVTYFFKSIRVPPGHSIRASNTLVKDPISKEEMDTLGPDSSDNQSKPDQTVDATLEGAFFGGDRMGNSGLLILMECMNGARCCNAMV